MKPFIQINFYSNVILSGQALVEYPDAKKVLEKHGRDRMEKNKEAAR